MAGKKWVMYGVSGVLGLSVLAGAASITASAMELHTNDGNVLEGGGVDAGTIGAVDKKDDRARPTASPQPTASPTVAPTRAPAPGQSADDPVQAPADPAPPAPAPVPVDPASPISVASAESVASAASNG